MDGQHYEMTSVATYFEPGYGYQVALVCLLVVFVHVLLTVSVVAFLD